jgi:hypothetical protein
MPSILSSRQTKIDFSDTKCNTTATFLTHCAPFAFAVKLQRHLSTESKIGGNFFNDGMSSFRSDDLILENRTIFQILSK